MSEKNPTKSPIDGELRDRIRLLKKYYKDKDEVKIWFFTTTKGYSEEDFENLYQNKNQTKYLQKENLCYFCLNSEVVKHHMSYYPEIIINLCKSCHSKVHFLFDEYHKIVKNVQKSVKKVEK